MPIFGALMGFSILFGPVTVPFSGVVPAAPDASAAPVVHRYLATLTAYNAVPSQTDNSPMETASGMWSDPQVVMARSRDLAKELPFGTIVAIDGSSISSKKTCGFGIVAPLIGYRIIADTMNARYTDRVDVLLGTRQDFTKTNGTRVNAADVLGICKGVTVRVVGYLDIKHLQSLPKTQAELAALVRKGGTELALNK